MRLEIKILFRLRSHWTLTRCERYFFPHALSAMSDKDRIRLRSTWRYECFEAFDWPIRR